MLVEIVRSGRVEAVHQVRVAVVDAEGRPVWRSGDVEAEFFARSSVKPFQAHVARKAGAPVADDTLAIGCASHAGRPDQVAAVEAVLEAAGLGRADLATPPALPSSRAALVALPPGTVPAPLFHNCSGKHAVTLAGCRAAGWSTADYRTVDHPIQQRFADELAAMVGHPIGEAGVDGCGFPTLPVSTLDLARAFTRLAVDPELAEERRAILDHPRLIGDRGADVVLAGGGLPAKSGAEGCLGVALPGPGLGIGLKAEDGSGRALGPAVRAVLSHLGLDAGDWTDALVPPVLGSGAPVGTVRVSAP